MDAVAAWVVRLDLNLEPSRTSRNEVLEVRVLLTETIAGQPAQFPRPDVVQLIGLRR
jgi:hypothetical protein